VWVGRPLGSWMCCLGTVILSSVQVQCWVQVYGLNSVSKLTTCCLSVPCWAGPRITGLEGPGCDQRPLVWVGTTDVLDCIPGY
jgi:hypothetical protein